MKKFFTILSAVALTLAATAGTPIATAVRAAKPAHLPSSHPASRALACDTILNLDFSTSDSNTSYWPLRAPGVGYLDGNGAVPAGPSVLPITHVGEKFTTVNNSSYVTLATAFFAFAVLNPTHADSILPVTAYVYDSLPRGYFNETSPGLTPVDSASTTTGFIADNGVAIFNFTNQHVLTGKTFFIMIKLPQVTGDTLVVISTDGVTGNGNAWLALSGIFASVDSSTTGALNIGNFIFATACSNVAACPTIAVTANQIGTSAQAVASATGGVAPYTFSWSTTPGQTNDTVSGLAANTTYTVTAADANGCTGVTTIRTAPGANGINDIAGVNFSIYPNPSNGAFTAALSMESATDVTISVLDMTGSKVYESTDKSVKELNKAINLNGVATGVYIVNIKTANGSTNQRITVK